MAFILIACEPPFAVQVALVKICVFCLRQAKFTKVDIRNALSGLRHFLPTESPLKMDKTAFYFTLKVLFILKIFKFLP